MKLLYAAKRRPLALALGLALLTLPALAQSSLSGIVRDPNHSVIAGATINLSSEDKKFQQTTKTDDQGAYSFSSLMAGTYELEAIVPGFSPRYASGIVLAQGASMQHDFDLSLEVRNDSIEVSAESGYRAESASISPVLGTRELLDLPYSITVMPQELVENVQSASFAALYRLNPLIQMGTTPDQGGNVTMRGFFQPNYSGKTLDGMRYLFQIPVIEDKGSLEVLTGLSGFLYGASNVGGTLNYTRKRPLPTSFANITLGDYGNKAFYSHADFGGLIDRDGKLGYRINVAQQNGGTPYGRQQTQRYMGSGALDWHATNKWLLQFDGAGANWNTDGSLPNWSFATNPNGSSRIFHVQPPSSNQLWNQTFTSSPQKSADSGVRTSYELNSHITFRGAYRLSLFDQPAQIFSNNNVTDNSGTYSQTYTKQGDIKYRQSAFYGMMDARFNTGHIRHLVTIGYMGDKYMQWRRSDTSSVTVNGFSFDAPQYIPMPTFGPAGQNPLRRGAVTNYNNLVLGDTIQLSRSWSATVGVNMAKILTANYNVANAAQTSRYSQWKPTPTASLTYKPLANVSTYFTYLEGLEPGAIVPTTGLVYTNAGQSLAPFTDHQYEAGVKAEVGRLNFTAAAFRIDRALQYGHNNNNGTYTYVQDGRQTNKGLEFTAIGKITRDLTVFGGATFFGAKVTKNQSNPLLVGKTPTDTAEQMVKARLEYNVRRVRGLYLIGGAYWTGKRFVDLLNTEKLNPYTFGDLGVRYETYWKRPVILRLDVTNISNAQYWQTSLYTGAPRAISVSVEFKLFGAQ